jgi:hypothetical protein
MDQKECLARLIAASDHLNGGGRLGPASYILVNPQMALVLRQVVFHKKPLYVLRNGRRSRRNVTPN